MSTSEPGSAPAGAVQNFGGPGFGLLPPITPVWQTYTYGSSTQQNSKPVFAFQPVCKPIGTSSSSVALPSNIVFFTKSMKAFYRPSQIVAYGYQYKNFSSKTASVKIIRTVKNGKGKIIEQSQIDLKLKPQAVFARQIKTKLNKYAKPGKYIVTVFVYSGKKIMEQKSINFIVKKGLFW
jgi:hypothetical protein